MKELINFLATCETDIIHDISYKVLNYNKRCA